MKILYSFFSLCLISNLIFAQDTVTVQTFTYDSTSRAAVFEFPDGSDSYRKILMEYSMHCKGDLVSTGQEPNKGCGEWDYHCNTVITDSTAVDSLRAFHPNFTVSNFDGDLFQYSNSPTYSYTQYAQKDVNYLSTNSEEEFVIVNGSESLDVTGAQAGACKIQTIYTSEELLAAGLSAGPMYGIKLMLENEVHLPFLRISLRSMDVANSLVEDFNDGNFQEVYFKSSSLNQGENHLKFYNPFSWDGESDITVDINFTGEVSESLEIIGTNDAAGKTIFTSSNDPHLLFTGADYVELQADNFASVDNGITISFWSKGDKSLPQNTFAFEGVNANNERQANVHLPWSDANIYWDCGNDGSGYDRISKASFTNEFEDVWTHWTFIKDADNGIMRILKNGEQWHFGNGKFKTMDIVKFVIGASKDYSTGYKGVIDDFRVWDIAIPENDIKPWINKPLTDDHPYNENLIANYTFDENDGSVVYDQNSNAVGISPIALNWRTKRGNELLNNFEEIAFKPNITFIKGEYELAVTDVLVLDSLVNPQHRVIAYDVVNSELVGIDTVMYYPGGISLILDENGDEVGEVTNNVDGELSFEELTYYQKSPARYEILSFITPYGIGLDLGPEGKTFTIDVSDYAPILKGNKRMSIEGVGNYQEELDIKFHFIKGTPHAEILELKQMWPIMKANQVWSGNTMSGILADRVLEPRDIFINENANYVKVKSAVTGHGQNGEFMPRDHTITGNDDLPVAAYRVWKECADNPVYPQGGAWIFDRAGWCPGMETDVHEFDFTPFINKGAENRFDYSITGADSEEMNYRVNNQMVIYGTPNFENDAEVYDIINPSKKTEYARINPSCNQPKFMLKNSGSEQLKSATITYGMVDGMTLTYEWTGNLNYLESRSIELDVLDHHFWESGSDQFFVSVSNANGVEDENTENNIMYSTYTPPFTSSNKLKFELRTNNRPQDNRYFIYNSAGEIVLQSPNLAQNTLYAEELELPGGCYTFHITDTGDDGLNFWFFPENGSGYMRLLELEPSTDIVLNANPDFGGDYYFDIIVNGTTSNKNIQEAQSLGVNPNPVHEELFVHWNAQKVEDGRLSIFNLEGKLIDVQNIQSQNSKYLNVKDLDAGLYILKIESAIGSIQKKFVKAQ